MNWYSWGVIRSSHHIPTRLDRVRIVVKFYNHTLRLRYGWIPLRYYPQLVFFHWKQSYQIIVNNKWSTFASAGFGCRIHVNQPLLSREASHVTPSVLSNWTISTGKKSNDNLKFSKSIKVQFIHIHSYPFIFIHSVRHEIGTNVSSIICGFHTKWGRCGILSFSRIGDFKASYRNFKAF